MYRFYRSTAGVIHALPRDFKKAMKGVQGTLNELVQSLGWVVNVSSAKHNIFFYVQWKAHTFVSKFVAGFPPFHACFWASPSSRVYVIDSPMHVKHDKSCDWTAFSQELRI